MMGACPWPSATGPGRSASPAPPGTLATAAATPALWQMMGWCVPGTAPALSGSAQLDLRCCLGVLTELGTANNSRSPFSEKFVLLRLMHMQRNECHSHLRIEGQSTLQSCPTGGPPEAACATTRTAGRCATSPVAGAPSPSVSPAPRHLRHA